MCILTWMDSEGIYLRRFATAKERAVYMKLLKKANDRIDAGSPYRTHHYKFEDDGAEDFEKHQEKKMKQIEKLFCGKN